MLPLLRIEWMKLKSYRTFWLLSVLYLLSIAGVNYIAFRIEQRAYNARQAKGLAQILIGDIPYAFPKVWQTAAYFSSYLLFMPGLLIIIFVTNEFSFKTHRQNIIDGWSRWQFILVKMATVLLMSIVSTIAVVITTIIFGYAEGVNGFSLEHSVYVLYYLIQAISYMMAALLIAVLVKRGGLAIGIYFLYTQVIENVLKFVLNHYFDTIGYYLPLQSTDELIPAPIFEKVQRQLIKPPDLTLLLIAAGVYLTAYIFLIRRKFLTDDL